MIFFPNVSQFVNTQASPKQPQSETGSKMEWLVSLYTLFFVFTLSFFSRIKMLSYTLFFVFTLSFYCLDRLPVLDFRPYKIGKNILEGMTMPEGAKPSVYESIFILEKNDKVNTKNSV